MDRLPSNDTTNPAASTESSLADAACEGIILEGETGTGEGLMHRADPNVLDGRPVSSRSSR
jgi:hypothetical protein